jgi:hypothetical protein
MHGKAKMLKAQGFRNKVYVLSKNESKRNLRPDSIAILSPGTDQTPSDSILKPKHIKFQEPVQPININLTLLSEIPFIC